MNTQLAKNVGNFFQGLFWVFTAMIVWQNVSWVAIPLGGILILTLFIIKKEIGKDKKRELFERVLLILAITLLVLWTLNEYWAPIHPFLSHSDIAISILAVAGICLDWGGGIALTLRITAWLVRWGAVILDILADKAEKFSGQKFTLPAKSNGGKTKTHVDLNQTAVQRHGH